MGSKRSYTLQFLVGSRLSLIRQSCSLKHGGLRLNRASANDILSFSSTLSSFLELVLLEEDGIPMSLCYVACAVDKSLLQLLHSTINS